MSIDLDKISIEFHTAARKIFFQLNEQFREGVALIDRHLDENVFQQQQARFVQILKSSLEDIAMSLLDKYKQDRKINELRVALTGFIKSYMNEFQQKTKFL